MADELTELEVDLLKQIRRVRALGLSQPAGSPTRQHCDEEVRMSIEAFANNDARRMDTRLFHLSRIRLYDKKRDAPPPGVHLPMSYLASLAARIEAAEAMAARGSGQSDGLYEKRVQAGYQEIIDHAPDAERAETVAKLRERGYDPDFEPYQAQDGQCGLTGIDENCCPCGQHP